MSEGLPNFNLNPLKKFNLNVLLDETRSSKKANAFIIALAAVYNDMKDLFWMYQILVDNKPPDVTVRNETTGQFAGMGNFVLRHLIGLFWEFLTLIKENKDVFNEESITCAEGRLGPESKAFWKSLKDLAITEKAVLPEKQQEIVECLVVIRNSVSFHFYHTKNFINGFNQYVTAAGSEAAVYASYGDQMEKTRFYFADAATQYQMMKYMKDKGAEDSEIIGFIGMMNQALRFLIEAFLDNQNKILNSNREERRYWDKVRGYK